MELPIARQGRIDYPGLAQVGKPADLAVQLFVAGQELPAQPGLTPVGRPVILPRHPDLQPYVAVSLDTLANPQDIRLLSAQLLQPLSDVDNIWLWQITPSAKQNMTLQPILHVEYHDAANRAVPAYNQDLPLSAQLTLTVVGPGAVDVAITVAERAGLPVAGLLLVGLLLLGGGARFPVNVNIRHTEIRQEVAAGGVASIGTLGNVQTGAGTQTNIAGPVQADGDVYLGSTLGAVPPDHGPASETGPAPGPGGPPMHP